VPSLEDVAQLEHVGKSKAVQKFLQSVD
jgi:hypothetical protein